MKVLYSSCHDTALSVPLSHQQEGLLLPPVTSALDSLVRGPNVGCLSLPTQRESHWISLTARGQDQLRREKQDEIK